MTTKKTIKVPLVLPPSNCALTRDMTKKGRKPKSQTPGTQKVATCQLLSIGGNPRKAYIKARGYKLKGYSEFCAWSDSVN
jgi:hypothetical protein